MARRYPDPRRVKLHQSYTIKEVAELLGKHPNTIRNWLDDGMQSLGEGRAKLIPAAEVHRYLKEKRAAGKRVCPPGTLYCFKCREPRTPAFNEVELTVSSSGRRSLTGLCSDCLTVMKQSVSAKRLGAFRKILIVKTAPPSKR